MKIIAIFGKGGCGKTTTTYHMALSLAGRGHSVMAIDGNEQPSGLGDAFGVMNRVGVKDCLTEGRQLSEVATLADGVMVVPTGVGLERVDLAEIHWDELFLESLLEELEDEPDFVLIDCSPVLQSVVSAAALACAHYAVTCVRPNKADTGFIAEVKLQAENTVNELSTELPTFMTVMTGVPRIGVDRIHEINLGSTVHKWPPNAPRSVRERLENVMSRDNFLGATPAAAEESTRFKTIKPYYEQIVSNMTSLNGLASVGHGEEEHHG